MPTDVTKVLDTMQSHIDLVKAECQRVGALLLDLAGATHSPELAKVHESLSNILTVMRRNHESLSAELVS